MKPTIEIYVGGPTSGTEASALSQLVEKLSDLGEPCLIFANFLCGPKKRQVDYFVVTSSRATHLELKHCLGPIEAPGEGAWFYKPMGGHRTRIPTSDGSPRRQAINTKYAISDAMEQFAVRNSDVPPPSGKYFKTFESAVCIYPTIQPGSVVDPGDRLARVWSFENCVNSIGGQAAVHKWPWEVWRRFADHLRLEKVTLPAAISPEVYRAKADLDALCSLQAAYFAERIADTVELGPELEVTEHLLLLGRKGVGKTTLAQRVVRRAAADGQLCFFLRAIKYRGDFGKMLQSAVGPFTSLSTKDLVETAKLCGAQILVVLDGADRINDDLRDDLLSDAAGFFERDPCTVVVTSSSEVPLPANIRGTTVVVSQLTLEDRQKIYRHYALGDAPEPDLSAFPTPQDLKVAGQAAAKLPKNATPSGVYDAYMRLHLGIDIASVGLRVCRGIAHEVFRRFTPFLAHQEFDKLAERYVAQAGASLSLVDRIKNTRLFENDVDGVAFAHDLLVNHLVAVDLVQAHQNDLASLETVIAQPLYQQIAGEIIGATPDRAVASQLLRRFPSVDLFGAGLRGELGTAVKNGLGVLLRDVLDASEAELESLELQLTVPETEKETPRVLPIVDEQIPAVDSCALQLIEDNIELYLPRILEILERYGNLLKEKVRSLAKTKRLRESVATSLYLQEEVVLAGAKLRCSLIAHLIGHTSTLRRRLSAPIVSAFDGAFGGRNNVNPIADFVLCSVWERAETPDFSKILTLFRKCWSSNVYYLRLKATDMISSHVRWLHESAKDRVPEVIEELESRLGDDPFYNTWLFDILARFEGFECPISQQAVEQEITTLLSDIRQSNNSGENELGLTVPQRAYRFVGNIFEEIISEPYFHAYFGLSVGDRVSLLNVAALNSDNTFNHDWIFGELVKLRDSSSQSVFAERCSSAPRKAFVIGENTKLFLLSILGLCRVGCPLPEWRDEEKSPQIAWKAVRDLLYNEWAGSTKHNDGLWMHLMSEDPLGGVSVILQVRDELPNIDRSFETNFDPGVAWGQHLKRFMEIGLKNWERLDLGDLGRGLSNPFRILVGMLENVGDEETVVLLEMFTNDEEKGRTAIEGIRKIKQRLRRSDAA